MKAYLKQVRGNTYIGKADSNHWVSFDTKEEDNGHGGSTSPMEMVLLALAACSSVDVEIIMRKKREPVDFFEVNIEAERRDEHPRVYTKVHLSFHFFGGDIKKESAEKALELSFTKYCSVAGMVGKTAEIKWTAEIN